MKTYIKQRTAYMLFVFMMTVLFLSGSIGSDVIATICDSGFTEVSGVCIPNDTGLSDQSVSSLLQKLMQWLLYILGTVAITAFVISGIMYLVSAGNDDMIDNAKRYMIWSIVGVLVALSGLVIITAIVSFLGGNNTF